MSGTPPGVMMVCVGDGGYLGSVGFWGEGICIFDPMVRNFHMLRWGWNGGSGPLVSQQPK